MQWDQLESNRVIIILQLMITFSDTVQEELLLYQSKPELCYKKIKLLFLWSLQGGQAPKDKGVQFLFVTKGDTDCIFQKCLYCPHLHPPVKGMCLAGFGFWMEEKRMRGPPSQNCKCSLAKPRTAVFLSSERFLELCRTICLMLSFHALLTSFPVWVSAWEFLLERKTGSKSQIENWKKWNGNKEIRRF